MQALRHPFDLSNDPVHPVADPQCFLHRLDEDVAGLGQDRLLNDRVRQLDQRGILRQILDFDAVGIGLRLSDQFHVLGLLDLMDDLLQGLARIRGVISLDRLLDLRRSGDDRCDVQSRQGLDIVDDKNVERVRHRQGQVVPHAGNRDDLIFDGDVQRNDFDNGGIDLKTGDVDGRHPQPFAQEMGQSLFADHVEADQNLAQFPAGFFCSSRARSRSLFDGIIPDEDLQQPFLEEDICYRGGL